MAETGRADPVEVCRGKGSLQKDQYGKGHIRELACLDGLMSIIKCGFSG